MPTTAPPILSAVSNVLQDEKVFPETKIKAQLRRHPSFGRIVETTMQSDRVGSGLLTHGIVEGILNQHDKPHSAAAEMITPAKGEIAETPNGVIRLTDVQEFIRQNAPQYHFVNGRIHKLVESEAAIKKSSKRPKRNPSKSIETDKTGATLDGPFQEALELAEKYEVTGGQQDLIVADEDDYD